MQDQRSIRLFAIAKWLMPAFLEIHENVLGGRQGIFLAIRHIYAEVDIPADGEIIGYLPSEKVEEKKSYGTEKINRMKINDEWCSLQSENEEAKQFGGGIRTTNFYMGPSGFLPHLDQKFVIMVALLAGELRVREYEQIMTLSLPGVNAWRHRNGESIITRDQF